MFGKKEGGGGFEITQGLVHDMVAAGKAVLTGALVPLYPNLPAYLLRPLVHLCISGKRSLLHNRDHCA